MDAETKNWAIACHALAFAGYVIPFGNLVGPLLVWALKKDSSPYIDQQGRESVNFQITMLIAYLISGILVLVFVGILLLAVCALFNVVMVVLAIIKTADGQDFRYPFAIRIL